jgi:hypothetical protein
LIGPLAGDTSPWKQVAREILAYADYHAGAIKQARAEFEVLAKDAKSPNGVRGRSRAMATFLAAGAGQDVGKVPMPEVPPSSATGSAGAPGGAKPNPNAPAGATGKAGANPPPITIETNVKPAAGNPGQAPNPSKGQSPK